MFPIDHFHNTALKHPSAIAVVSDSISMTYSELALDAFALASALQTIDPTPQSRVGICAYNTYEHLLGWLAVFAAGKVWVPLNPRNGYEELKRIVAMTKPSIIIADGNCLEKLTPEGAKVIVGQSSSDNLCELETLNFLISCHIGTSPKRHNLQLDDIQALKFTGGSSGTPKGVVQTYRVWNTCITSMISSFNLNQTDRNLLAAPMTHGTNTLIMPIFSVGGSQAFMGLPKPASIIDAIETYRPTTCFLPPTVIYMMMAESGIEKRDFSSLRHLIVGGASIRPDVVPDAMAMFNNALETCFGQTEVPQIATCMRAYDWRDPRNASSTGRVTELTEIAIMDHEGTILGSGETGELVIKGDLVMAGYLDRPDLTSKIIIGGWLHTGDIGVIDERGFLFIKDRIRDVIITGGFNVYPSDVEAVLGTHPDVRECVVFGIPDSKWGEAVHGAVELHNGATEDDVAIIDYIKQHLDSVKTPKRIHFSNALPRSPVGKVLRREAISLYSKN